VKVRSFETVTTILGEDRFKQEVTGESAAEVVSERQKKCERTSQLEGKEVIGVPFTTSHVTGVGTY
jgi:hypothetical protein